MHGCRPHHRADRGIHARRVTATGQHSHTLYAAHRSPLQPHVCHTA